ncbi:MAG: Ig-like domain-containing protein [Bacteroidetes bacterium]|uniref:Ig-like domain-containing protein n=1 Tax=Candidatus Merdivivens pullistercoris TaxID=2840873 RepID=A0A9D9I4U5_9BACT|nr:Ig-like domain-containing protein [Candidatus Merdivivens pullistercoris]
MLLKKRQKPARKPISNVLRKNFKQLLTVGETGQLEASVLPENAGYGEILWTSSDESVAIVHCKALQRAFRMEKAHYRF